MSQFQLNALTSIKLVKNTLTVYKHSILSTDSCVMKQYNFIGLPTIYSCMINYHINCMYSNPLGFGPWRFLSGIAGAVTYIPQSYMLLLMHTWPVVYLGMSLCPTKDSWCPTYQYTLIKQSVTLTKQSRRVLYNQEKQLGEVAFVTYSTITAGLKSYCEVVLTFLLFIF